jgi:hypothetical protein
MSPTCFAAAKLDPLLFGKVSCGLAKRLKWGILGGSAMASRSVFGRIAGLAIQYWPLYVTVNEKGRQLLVLSILPRTRGSEMVPTLLISVLGGVSSFRWSTDRLTFDSRCIILYCENYTYSCVLGHGQSYFPTFLLLLLE